MLVELVVFLLLCFDVFLAVFFAGAVLFWAGADWLGAGVVDCAKVSGRLAAAKTSASKLFFILILQGGAPVRPIPNSGAQVKLRRE